MIGPNVKVTSVYFNPGFKWAATQIANMIHVKLRDVVPLNGQRPAPGASSDDVVLILGPDAPNIGWLRLRRQVHGVALQRRT